MPKRKGLPLGAFMKPKDGQRVSPPSGRLLCKYCYVILRKDIDIRNITLYNINKR